jgi:pimeloyl-ACP methyl ester carboxylesterase
MKIKLLVLAYLIHFLVSSQENAFVTNNISINKYVDGTLLTPTQESDDKLNLAIIIADSGPIDRNGNQKFQKNNTLKKLAESLTIKGIATFRYDKRVVKQIRNRYVNQDITFDDFITDAKSVIAYFKSGNTYNNIYIIGHGQGSLVGMIAALENVDGFISIAGSGQPIDHVILEQIENTAPMFTNDAKKVFDILKQGKTISNYPEALSSIFSLDIQPFMMNWMQYDPQEIIKQFKIPVLIINGTKDLQVTIEEASLLKHASPNASLELIDNMNHIMFLIEGGDLENSKSYNESFREIAPELIDALTTFIN